jgi:hypothetical protein
MYKVSYYLSGSTQVVFKWFKSLTEATTFANQRPIESVIEIKYYESDELITAD